MESKIKFDFVRPLLDEAFKNGQGFFFKPNGRSMRPFIKGGNTDVCVEKYKGGAKKYDIIFYKRDDGKHVMHRIVKIYPDSFGACGDNQWWIEKVNESQIFGIVTSVGGREKTGSFLYLHTLPVRRFILHVKAYIKKHFGGNKK